MMGTGLGAAPASPAGGGHAAGLGARCYLRSGEALQAGAAVHAGHASVPLEGAWGQGEMQAQHPPGAPKYPP